MKIEWLGDGEIIPNHGVMIKGCNAELPDEIAQSFIDQGKAKLYETAKPVKKSIHTED